jgi:zinc transporter ZupT
MTPIGIAIGWGMSEGVKGQSTLLAHAIIYALTAGSFLFISASELLPAALHDGRYTPHKVATFAVGFGAMAILAAYV